uniref:BAR/IMD domain containing adaptor protein 2 like 2a n=1 Tax=Scleropages formosus TaxID=113540 RepID=A0A8C9V1W2_SCLFO
TLLLQFRWFHTEVLQEMDQNVKLDKEYISVNIDSSQRYSYYAGCRVSDRARLCLQDSGDYLQFLRQSQREALAEEERRYRFLAEKHCGLTQSILYLMNKVCASPQQSTRLRHNLPVQYYSGRRDSSLRSFDPVLPLEDGSPKALNGPSPQPSRSSGGSLRVGRQMRALVPHTHSSDPTLLPFSRGETVTVLVEKPRNGWLYGRAQGSSHQGWFPAAYVEPIEDTPKSTGSNTCCGSVVSDVSASVFQGQPPDLFPRGTNPFATVKLKPTATNDRSAPRF